MEIALPLPEAAPHEPVPVVMEHVQVTPVIAAGTVSVTVAPVTFEGPLLVTVTVYEMPEPGTSVADPSVFVTARSAWAPSVSVSVAELLPGVGSVVPPGTAALAVFTSEPVAEAETVPDTTYVATAPEFSETVVEIEFPEPDAAPHEPVPVVIEQVQVTPVTAAGTVSDTVAPATFDGPLFVTVTV